jgi:hypothetical protein
MSDISVNIPIRTTANLAGAQAAEKSLKELSAELKETQRQMHKLSESSPDYAQLSSRADELRGKLNQLGEGSERAAGGGRNMGNAMLQGSRAIDDLQYGLPGVINNIEGIASAMGAGAGAAGAATVLAVALNLVWKNWDKISGSIDQTKPLWTALTPDEESQKRLDEFNKTLERQADLVERIANAKINALKAQQAENETLAKLADIWKDLVPEKNGGLPPAPGTEGPSKEMQKKQIDTAQAKTEYDAKVTEAMQADEAFQRQKKIVDDTVKRGNFQGLKDAQDAADKERLDQLRGTGSEAAIEERKKIEQGMKDRAAKFRDQTAGLAVPAGMQPPTGDAEKDAAAQKAALDQEREKLKIAEAERLSRAQAAEQARGGLNTAEKAQNDQGRIETAQRQADAYKQIGLPPAPGAVPSFDAASGFVAPIEQQGTQVSDGLRQVAQSVKGVFSQLQGSSAEMQQGLTQALGGMIENQSALVALVRGFQPQIEQLRQQINTR